MRQHATWRRPPLLPLLLLWWNSVVTLFRLVATAVLYSRRAPRRSTTARLESRKYIWAPAASPTIILLAVITGTTAVTALAVVVAGRGVSTHAAAVTKVVVGGDVAIATAITAALLATASAIPVLVAVSTIGVVAVVVVADTLAAVLLDTPPRGALRSAGDRPS